jgi:hypothetical protein
MFQEEIAAYTASHLRVHIGGYLSEIQAVKNDGIKLALPKTVETANLVGGVYAAKLDALPAYAIDIIEKDFIPNPDDLWLYQYTGHIAALISANSEESANKIIKRHEQAVEKFVRIHNLLHEHKEALWTVREMGFGGAGFSGAELVAEDVEKRKLWVAGFRIDLVWLISEEGPTQHG